MNFKKYRISYYLQTGAGNAVIRQLTNENKQEKPLWWVREMHDRQRAYLFVIDGYKLSVSIFHK